MAQLQQMMGVEAETVELESWNFDVSIELLKVTQKLGRIPFGGGSSTLFDTEPSLDSKGKERDVKGKGRESDKRTIYNLHPKDSTDAWLGEFPGKLILPKCGFRLRFTRALAKDACPSPFKNWR